MNNKDTIIHEAQKLFSLNGYLNTGINEIIEAAGTSKGGFYNHFASKEELFHAVLSEAQKIWRDKIITPITDTGSPVETIVQILTNYRDNYLKDSDNFPGGCIFITFSVELDDTFPHLVKEVHEGFEGFKGLLKRLLAEGIEADELPTDLNPTTVSEMLFTGMLGSSVLFGVDKTQSTLDCSIDSLVEYLFMLTNKNVINHVNQLIPGGLQEDCFDSD
jgi:TetR/AcrR family transcriptional repressor of nem operon